MEVLIPNCWGVFVTYEFSRCIGYLGFDFINLSNESKSDSFYFDVIQANIRITWLECHRRKCETIIAVGDQNANSIGGSGSAFIHRFTYLVGRHSDGLLKDDPYYAFRTRRRRQRTLICPKGSVIGQERCWINWNGQFRGRPFVFDVGQLGDDFVEFLVPFSQLRTATG